MERDELGLRKIKNTCGQCPKLNNCLFGNPAMDTLGRMRQEDQKSAVLYLWDKYQDRALAICPKPEEVKGAIAILEIPQR